MLSKFISARQEKSGIGVLRANTETITVNTDDNLELRVKPPDTRVSCSFFSSELGLVSFLFVGDRS